MILWLCSPPGSRPLVEVSGRPVDDPGIDADGARRFVLGGLEPGDRITVRARSEDLDWSLKIVSRPRPAWLDQARDWGRQGSREEIDAAIELLRRRLQDGSLEAGTRGAAMGLLARMGVPEADELLERAVSLFVARGRLQEAALDIAMLSQKDVGSLRFTTARRRLEASILGPQAPAEARYHAAYGRALLADRTGDLRTAIQELRCATAWARRFELRLEAWLAEQYRAELLQGLGKFREAADIFADLRRDPPPQLRRCEWPQFENNEGWGRLLAREAGEDIGDPKPLLKAARDGFDQQECRTEQRLNTRLNLALAHLQEGRSEAAHAALAEVDSFAAGDVPLLAEVWRMQIEGRLALLEKRPRRALEIFRRAEKRAATGHYFAGRWAAAVGQGRAHAALGQKEAALAVLAQAEDLLDERSLRIPVDAGRETFAGQHQKGTRLYLELLLDAGRDQEALALARRSRSRVLRHLWRGNRLSLLDREAQQRWDAALGEYLELRAHLVRSAETAWQLPADQQARAATEREHLQERARVVLDRALAVLEDEAEPFIPPPPQPGEIVLAYHPLPEGWVGFAATPDGIEIHRFSLPPSFDPDAIAKAVLEPFAAAIAGRERIKILPFGSLRQVDFHALPFGKDILLARMPVIYGLEIGAPASTDRPASPHALIVADPRGDLANTRREAENAARALGRHGWSTTRLLGERASLAAVRSGLADADLLHYAGHSELAGPSGWESALLLADGTRFTLGDLLALDQAPRFVVLSACESGRTASAAPVESLGLAQAFLLAGAREVVATVRPVGDRDAAELFRQFYRLLTDHGANEPDLSLLLRRAQLAWRQVDPKADWASFRTFEP